MKVVIFILLALLLGGGGFVAFLPMSMAADLASKQLPDFRYMEASGSVWDGKLTEVTIGDQKIGDLSVKADMGSVLSGKGAGKLALSREGLTGESGISWPFLGGQLEFNELKLKGKAGLAPGMPEVVALGGGDFELEIAQLTFVGDVCESARGNVWTDALARVDVKGWVGPELRGPVSCKDGKLAVEAAGRSATGEDIHARLDITSRLDMNLTAIVLNAEGGAVEALTTLGFRAEGEALVLRRALGS
jgi:hypothetical protein